MNTNTVQKSKHNRSYHTHVTHTITRFQESLSLSLSLCTALADLCPPIGRAGARVIKSLCFHSWMMPRALTSATQISALAMACSATACPITCPSSRKFFRAWLAACNRGASLRLQILFVAPALATIFIYFRALLLLSCKLIARPFKDSSNVVQVAESVPSPKMSYHVL